MREIIIKTVYREDGHHVIRLGNGTIHRFKSDKGARKFLAATNRFLTDLFFKLNQVQAELYTHGREIWIISKEIREADHVDDRLHSLEVLLKRIQWRSSFAAGNYFTLIDIRKYCESAKSLIKFFKGIRYVGQTDTLRRHKLECLFDHVHVIEMQLLNYGQNEAWQLFSTDKLAGVGDLSYSPNQHLKIA